MCHAKGIRKQSENVVKNILKPLNLSKTNQLSIKNDHDQRFGTKAPPPNFYLLVEKPLF
jgi:hypothetical protein